MPASTFRVEHPVPGARHTEENSTTSARIVVPRFPSLTTTVPGELVHLAGATEALLTDWERTDDTHFTVAAP
ncbi:hypothetical protein ADK65_25520 [Streptomyces sp. NRRL B-1140]|uniref:hypothetical protein n=1 Tax=Streptomyces sp. NRRL B-1140 TaxID=1415549 RepID=UPI0006AF31A5|nr:hypothetical protein [Streptomyces sp. NRRL B-1140]KOV97486.1 hypothetical protein ADK65_25520 [Streptomyces sp. NRRL B-1140]